MQFVSWFILERFWKINELRESIIEIETELETLWLELNEIDAIRLNTAWKETIDNLSDEDAGQLLKAIYALSAGEENPIDENDSKEIHFILIITCKE